MSPRSPPGATTLAGGAARRRRKRKLGDLRPDVPLAVVYTDVAGSTAANQELGDAVAHALLRTHHSIVRAAVSRHEGVELDLMGDGFKLAFDDAGQALRCAVAVQREMAAHTERHPDRPIAIRVGIHAGPVIHETDDLFGETLILAQRVMARARAGEILVSEALLGDARSLRDIGVVDRGIYRLKGLRGAHRVYEVLWKPDAAESIGTPRPARAAPGLPTPFVGREPELALLETALEQAENGIGHVALLSGEPGIGKTRLAREFLALMQHRKLITAAGRCYARLAQPFQPFLECLHRLIEEHGVPGLPFPLDFRPLAALAPDLASRLPKSDPEAPGSEPADDRLRLLNSFASLLLAWSNKLPLVLLIDDLQWADTHSLDLLRYLGRRLSPVLGRSAPILVVGTCRDPEQPEPPAAEAVFREFDHDRLLLRIPVFGLSEPEVGALLRGLGGKRAKQLAPLVYQRSQGNPYFVEELYRDAAERSILDGESAPWEPEAAGPAAVPARLKDVLEQRLGRLGVRSLKVVRLASLIGSRFSFDVLCAATDLGETDVVAALEESIAARIVRETGRPEDPHFAFEHTLVSETLSEQIAAPRARLWHLDIADALEEVNGEAASERPGEIAHHLIEAGRAAPAERVERWCRLAGEQASQAFAFEDAVRFYKAALAAAGRLPKATAPARAELQSSLATALGRTGRIDEGRSVADEAIRTFTAAGRNDRADATREAIASMLALHARYRDALPYLAAVARRVGAEPDGSSARVLGDYAVALDLTGRSEEARAAADRVLEIAPRLRNRELRRRALQILRTWQANHTSDLRRALTLSRRLERLAERRGDAWDLASCWADIGLFEFVGGRVAKAIEALDRALELAVRSGTFATIVDVRSVRAVCFCYRGEWERVDEEWTNAAPLLGRVPGALRLGLLFWARSLADAWLGRPAPRVEAPEKLYSGSAQLQNDVLAGTGLLASERGDPAATSILEAAHRRQPRGGAGVNWLLGSQAIATGWVNLGRRREAEQWYEPLEPYRGTLLVGSTDLVLGRIAALARRHATARADLNRAIRLCRREGLRPYLALALCERAAAQPLRPGARARALGEAGDIFESLGMRLHAERVETLIRRIQP